MTAAPCLILAITSLKQHSNLPMLRIRRYTSEKLYLLIDGLKVRIEVLYGFFTLFFAEQLRFSAMVGLPAEHAQ